MTDKQDPQLQAPQEANTGKHINFPDAEALSETTHTTESFKDDDNPTRQQWEVMRKKLKEDDSAKESL